MSNEPTTPLTYYAQHWLMTEPGSGTHLLMNLPQAIPLICEVVQGLIIHYRTGALYKVKLPLKRLEETHPPHIPHSRPHLRVG